MDEQRAAQEAAEAAGGQAAPDAGERENFETLIRGKYKAEFDARVRKILDGRLRGLRQENLRLRQAAELAELAGLARQREQEEQLRRAMGYAIERARQQMAQSIASGGRVAENGGRRRSVSRWDPKGLSSGELAAIRKRVMDGEKIRF